MWMLAAETNLVQLGTFVSAIAAVLTVIVLAFNNAGTRRTANFNAQIDAALKLDDRDRKVKAEIKADLKAQFAEQIAELEREILSCEEDKARLTERVARLENKSG